MVPITNILIPVLGITSFSSTESAIAPIVTLALLIDAGIVGVWYMLGALLSNSTVKAAAKGEAYQLIGTIVMAAIIVGALAAFGIMFFSIGNSTVLLNASSIHSMCSNVMDTSNIALLNPSVYKSMTGSSNSLLSSLGSFPGLCSMVDMGSSPSLTQQIDYPLAASGVIIANLTNQSANQLNQVFIVDAWMGFLAKVTPQVTFCLGPTPFLVSVQCILPESPVPPILKVTTSLTPYAGFEMVYKSFTTLGTLLSTAFEAFIAQLTITSAFAYLWPYLLFAGIALRATFFTRRLGGLLIAIAVGGILFYPALFSVEYLTLGNGLGGITGFSPTTNTYSTNSIPSAYGFNSIFTSSVTFIPANPQGTIPYITNYYVLPQAKPIAEYDGCWPGVAQGQDGTGNLLAAEVEVTAVLDLGGSIESIISAASSGAIPSVVGLISNCGRDNALATLFDMFKVYGVDGIAAYFLPIINLMIVLAGIIGLSGLMGGDTSLAGLSRLV